MINFLHTRLFTLNHEYGDVISQQRAQRLLWINGTIFIVAILRLILFTVPMVVNGTYSVLDFLPSAALIATFVVYYLIQNGYALWGARLFVSVLLLVTLGVNLDLLHTPFAILTMVPLVLAGVILQRNELWVTATIILAVFFRSTFLLTGNLQIETTTGIAMMVSVLLVTVAITLFNSSLEDIINKTATLMREIRGLSKFETSPSNDSSEAIVSDAINVLRTNVGYSYIRVVLLSASNEPLRTLYSSIGVERVAETSEFTFAPGSAFQQAIATQRAVNLSNTEETALTSHLLPSSRQGLVIPAIGFGQLVALFDIQTEYDQPISDDETAVLSFFIEQVACAIVHRSTIRSLRADITEQQAIINRQRRQIENIQFKQSQGISTDWGHYLEQRGLDAIGYDIDERRQISELDEGAIPDVLKPAFEKGEIVVQRTEDEQIVTIPIRFRDTVLGAMSFSLPLVISLTDRKIDFIRSVTDRLALALDNKRLLEQTQTQAERERAANEIGSLLLRSTEVQTVLQTAAERFNEALGAVTTRIYLQPTTVHQPDNKQIEDLV